MDEDTKQPVTDKPVGDAAAATPKYMTAEEFNKASTMREKRLLDKFAEMIKAQTPKQAPAVASEESEEDDVEEETEEAEEQPKQAPKQAAKKATPTRTPSKAELAARQALQKATALEKAAKEDKAALVQKEAELQAKQERSDILSALTEAQSPAPTHALAVLKASGKIKRNDDGDVVFVAAREAAGEKYDEEIPLADGIREWLDSPEGKLYAAPKGAEGSGAGAQGKNGKGGKAVKDMSKAERKRAAGSALMKWALNR